jgi:hypothetical protein
MAMDTYVSFDFIPPMQPGQFGPCYEVRTYTCSSPAAWRRRSKLWRKAVPGRVKFRRCSPR